MAEATGGGLHASSARSPLAAPRILPPVALGVLLYFARMNRGFLLGGPDEGVVAAVTKASLYAAEVRGNNKGTSPGRKRPN